MRRIGLLHPGAMGASVGAAARSNQHTVLWASAGRTASTGARARRADLEDAGTVAELVKKEGVRAELARQWGDAFTEQAVRRVCANTAKAWRFVGEMHEIAATFRGAGLPGGFHDAAAEVYERLAMFKDHP